MQTGIYEIADHVIRIESIYSRIHRMCVDYRSEGMPQLTVATTQADLAFEREKSAQEDRLEGLPVRHYSDDYLETLAVYRKLVRALLPDDILLFHGSAVAVDGQVYLFTARSGTGKTTHTRLWLREIPGSFVVNGDKPLLKFTPDGVFVCGTPWQGKENLGTNTILPLKAVCVLERAGENRIAPLSPAEAFPLLLAQAYRPKEMEPMLRTMELVGRLREEVALYRLGCNMLPEAAHISYGGMRG